MRFAAVIGLLVIIGTASVALGEKKNAPPEADVLAKEVMSKVVFRSSTVLARVDDCRLNIRFDATDAAFDLPLQETAVKPAETDDGIVVTNRNMTRTIKNRAPESFQRLALRTHRDMMQPLIKAFQDAIAACGGNTSNVAAAAAQR